MVNIQTTGARVNKHITQQYIKISRVIEKNNTLDKLFEEDKAAGRSLPLNCKN